MQYFSDFTGSDKMPMLLLYDIVFYLHLFLSNYPFTDLCFVLYDVIALNISTGYRGFINTLWYAFTEISFSKLWLIFIILLINFAVIISPSLFWIFPFSFLWCIISFLWFLFRGFLIWVFDLGHPKTSSSLSFSGM